MSQLVEKKRCLQNCLGFFDKDFLSYVNKAGYLNGRDMHL
jgi:hypothetical protein